MPNDSPSDWVLSDQDLDGAQKLMGLGDRVYDQAGEFCGRHSKLIRAVRAALPGDVGERAFDAVLAHVLSLCERRGPNKKLVPDVVVLIHGIRDRAQWYQEVTEVLQSSRLVVTGVKYGRFDLIRFISPINFGGKPRERIENFLRDTRTAYPDSRISVIAHSFGSHLITEVLQACPDIRIHRLVLCGAVVKQDFRWSKVGSQIGVVDEPDKRRFIVNDCGDADAWPALGQAVGWRYGNSGTHGFGDVLVSDRFHKGNHSLFFDRSFVGRCWKPFIETGEITSGDGKQSERIGGVLSALALVPWRWMILVAVVSALVAPLYLLGRTLGVLP